MDPFGIRFPEQILSIANHMIYVRANSKSAAENWDTIAIPETARLMYIVMSGGGGGGGGGVAVAATTASSGGSGGSGGTLFQGLYSVPLLPRTLQASIGFGGAGGAASSNGVAGIGSYIGFKPTTSSQGYMYFAGGGGKGNVGVSGSNSTADASTAVTTGDRLTLGLMALTNITGQTGQTSTSGSQSVSYALNSRRGGFGGTCGGGTTNGNAGIASGSIQANTAQADLDPLYTPTTGSAVGTNGNEGFHLNYPYPFAVMSGRGGGGNAAANAGAGGSGGPGCGGGGGGSTTNGGTAGAGGKGGDGFAIIMFI